MGDYRELLEIRALFQGFKVGSIVNQIAYHLIDGQLFTYFFFKCQTIVLGL